MINELLVNPPGNDAPNEYIEIRGNANEVLAASTYLLGIEGDFGANAGDVQDIFDLSGLTLGSRTAFWCCCKRGILIRRRQARRC